MRPSSVCRYAWETDWLDSLGLLLISRYFLFTLSYVVFVKRKEEGSVHERKERMGKLLHVHSFFLKFFFLCCLCSWLWQPTNCCNWLWCYNQLKFFLPIGSSSTSSLLVESAVIIDHYKWLTATVDRLVSSPLFVFSFLLLSYPAAPSSLSIIIIIFFSSYPSLPFLASFFFFFLF